MLIFLVFVAYPFALITALMLIYGTPPTLRTALAPYPEGLVYRLTFGERLAIFWLAIPLTIYYAIGPYGSGWDFLTIEAPVLIFKGRRVWPSDFH